MKRADYIKGLTDKIRCDPTIRYVFYLLDYGANWYSEEFHSGGDMEQKMDQGLSYFSYLCYLENKEIITPEEFKFFEYEIKRILLDPGVQDYFYNIYHFTKKLEVPFTFPYLFDYGNKHDFFDKDFFDPTSYRTNPKYHAYLNF